MPTAGGMAQLTQCLGFDLPDAFACYVEIPAYFFQGVILAIDQPEPQLEHLAFPL